jgi:hypothetical protein
MVMVEAAAAEVAAAVRVRVVAVRGMVVRVAVMVRAMAWGVAVRVVLPGRVLRLAAATPEKQVAASPHVDRSRSNHYRGGRRCE